ncbi:MAG: hypothetical protein LBK47_06570 [Prevotellaceae bacterium]|jgi:hypothetical protein|nr:hypothetical protein [Prevotellaceae bacterium]
MAKNGNRMDFLDKVYTAVQRDPKGSATELVIEETPEPKKGGLSLLLDEAELQVTPIEPVPQPTPKKGVEKNTSIDNAQLSDLGISSLGFVEFAEKMKEASRCRISIHPEHDYKLADLAHKLRYGQKATITSSSSVKASINKQNLLFLILENALKNVEV